MGDKTFYESIDEDGPVEDEEGVGEFDENDAPGTWRPRSRNVRPSVDE